MTKILFVIPKVPYYARSDFPPLGVAYLCAYLREKMPDAILKIIDYSVTNFSNDNWILTLKNFSPDFLGISLSTLHYPHAISVSTLAKKHSPNTQIIWGGPHVVDTEYDDILNYCNYLVAGEGEIALYELIKKLKEGEGIERVRGIAYKKENKIIKAFPQERIQDIGSLPLPAYDLLNLKKYFEYPMIGVIGGRWCPFNCTFCGSPLRWKEKVKDRSTENIVNEIEFLHKVYDIKGIFFVDDLINLPQKRAIDLCEEIINRGLHKRLYFQAQLRANNSCVSSHLFNKLKEANFKRISFGAESGSQKVLDAMNKKVTVKELKRAILLGKESGIDTRAFFMIGNWDEDILDVLKTVKFIFETRVHPSLGISTPFPGTKFYKKLKDGGYLQKTDWTKAYAKIAICGTNKMSKNTINIIYWMLYTFFYFKKAVDLPKERKIDYIWKIWKSIKTSIITKIY